MKPSRKLKHALFGRSISRDLTISLITIALLATSAISLYSYHRQTSKILLTLNEKADETISRIVNILAVPLWNLDHSSIALVGSTFVENDFVTRIKITDFRGAILFHKDKGEQLSETIKRTESILYNGQILGKAELALSLKSYSASLNRLLAVSILSTLAAVLVVALATGILLKIFIRKPLDALLRGADRVAKGEYSHAFEDIRQKELLDIIERFRVMSSEVESRETALNRINLELKRAEKKYHDIFMNAQEGIFQLSWSKGMLSANPAMARMLGYDTPEELIADVDETSKLYVKQEAQQEFRSLIAEQGSVKDYETQLFSRDGNHVWCIISAQTIRDDNSGEEYLEGSVFDITLRKKMEDELRHKAQHDPLTGLANRTVCLDRIQRALTRNSRRKSYHYSVVFVDLDRFKTINDSYGHNFGDKLLVEVSKRLLNCVRDLDTVSRIGGDEFLVLLEELESPRMAIQVVNRIRKELNQPTIINDREVHLSASIGIVLDAHGETQPKEIIHQANIAMRRAKKSGKDRIKVFTPRMMDRAILLLTLENDMDLAIARNQFFLEFQPIISIKNGVSLHGFEALVRWNHPTKGVLSPMDFIPLAEETGKIVDLGSLVLNQACKTLAAWREEIPEARNLSLSVNVSGRQFIQTDLVPKVKKTLQDTGVPPESLRLEVTETAIMDNSKAVVDKLTQFRNAGIGISVDDFGTGYSSMSYLQRLPLDTLKIDLSFVREMDEAQENLEIVMTIINLAHSLGLEVVAEGVEKTEQHEILSQLGCEYLQGYLYSKPQPEEKARETIMRLAEGDSYFNIGLTKKS